MPINVAEAGAATEESRIKDSMRFGSSSRGEASEERQMASFLGGPLSRANAITPSRPKGL